MDPYIPSFHGGNFGRVCLSSGLAQTVMVLIVERDLELSIAVWNPHVKIPESQRFHCRQVSVGMTDRFPGF